MGPNDSTYRDLFLAEVEMDIVAAEHLVAVPPERRFPDELSWLRRLQERYD